MVGQLQFPRVGRVAGLVGDAQRLEARHDLVGDVLAVGHHAEGRCDVQSHRATPLRSLAGRGISGRVIATPAGSTGPRAARPGLASSTARRMAGDCSP
ncbi:hypothetical protein G6F24_016130 [Rhizopus arrhizus]|nr:hypothetical protein G6F24_016130 [Rhizopus arrhizus]